MNRTQGGATPRERMLAALEFRNPDRIPVVYHPSPAGLYTHGRKLLDLFRRYPPDNFLWWPEGPPTFETMPQPPAGTVDAEGRYHEIRKDEWGTTWEHLIFGVWGHPKAYPFPSWAAARAFAFPPLPAPGAADLAAARARAQTLMQTHLVIQRGGSIFEKLHGLQPFEEVLMGVADRDPDFLALLDRLTDYWSRWIDHGLAVGGDLFSFGDDLGTQEAPLMSRAAFRDVFRPRYDRLMDPIRRAGKRIFFHICGCMDYVFDELVDLGVTVLWPQIRFCDSEAFAQRCKARGVTILIHPDRQRLVPCGTPAEIDRKIAELADRYRRLGGGGIFWIEIENDAPFENVQALVEAVDRHR
jgi:uroporphyrinogen decarboxylase